MKKVFLFCMVLALVMVSCAKEPEINKENNENNQKIKLEKLHYFVEGKNNFCNYIFPKYNVSEIDDTYDNPITVRGKDAQHKDYEVDDVNLLIYTSDTEKINLCFYFSNNSNLYLDDNKEYEIPSYYIKDKENNTIQLQTKKQENNEIFYFEIPVDFSILKDLWDTQIFDYEIKYGFDAFNYTTKKFRIAVKEIKLLSLEHEIEYSSYKDFKIDSILIDNNEITYNLENNKIKINDENNLNKNIKFKIYFKKDWSDTLDLEGIKIYINNNERNYISFFGNLNEFSEYYGKILEISLSNTDFNEENQINVKIKKDDIFEQQFIIEK